jgi:hypothetical protein
MTDLLGLDNLNEVDQGDDQFRMRGRSVGAELLIRRSLTHDLGGWLSYTVSRSDRSAGRLEGPAGTDRTHVLNLALSYDLGRNWRAGSRLMFYTGVPARVVDLEQARNPPRTPPYYRVDWRLEKRWPHADNSGHWALVFEVLNTTLNREVVSRDCGMGPCRDEELGPLTIPSVGVEAAY